jgi:hypothetical protein
LFKLSITIGSISPGSSINPLALVTPVGHTNIFHTLVDNAFITTNCHTSAVGIPTCVFVVAIATCQLNRFQVAEELIGAATDNIAQFSLTTNCLISPDDVIHHITGCEFQSKDRFSQPIGYFLLIFSYY